MGRGRSIWDLEQAWHLPSELSLQQAAMEHPLVIQFCNVYYATAHVTAVILVLIWAFVWHRDRYPQLRNVLALLTSPSGIVNRIVSGVMKQPDRAHRFYPYLRGGRNLGACLPRAEEPAEPRPSAWCWWTGPAGGGATCRC